MTGRAPSSGCGDGEDYLNPFPLVGGAKRVGGGVAERSTLPFPLPGPFVPGPLRWPLRKDDTHKSRSVPSFCAPPFCENHARKMRTFFTRRLEPNVSHQVCS